MPAIREYNPDVFSVPIDEDWLDAQAALRYAALAAEATPPSTPIQAGPVGSQLGPLQCVLIPPTPNTISPISPPHSATPSTKSSVQWIHRSIKANAPSSWRHDPSSEAFPVLLPAGTPPLDIKAPPHRRFPSTSSVSSQSSAASSAMPMTPPEWSTTNLSSSAPPNVARSILARTASKRSTSSAATTAKSVKFNERPMVYSPIYDFTTSESERENARTLIPPSVAQASQKKKSPLRRLLTASSKSPAQPPTISGPFALGSFAGGRRPDLECERVRPKGARARPDQSQPQPQPRRSSLQLHRTSSVESMKSARSVGGRSVKSESGKSMLSIRSVSSIRSWFERSIHGIENLKAVGRRAG